jgi:uncharacterized protein (TIRG00374 family)
VEQNGKSFILKRELLRKRTLFSFALSVLLLYFFLSQTSLGELWRQMKEIALWPLLVAFVCHYAAYTLRGGRWRRLIVRTGFTGSSLGLAKIIFLFQAVDCVLPAKVGDLYGAHLMKLNYGLSRSYSLGSIFMWRLLDLVIVVALGIVTAFLVFGSTIPTEVAIALEVSAAVVVAVGGFVGLLFVRKKLWSFSFKNERINQIIDSFRHGLKLRWHDVPALIVSTGVIWLLESARFYFVCMAVGVDLGVVPVIFIACVATMLTAVPFTPSGLGAVEFGMLELLGLVGVGHGLAFPLIIWDRFIAHWSQILFGVGIILFSKPLNLKIWHFKEDGVTGESVPSPDPAVSCRGR